MQINQPHPAVLVYIDKQHNGRISGLREALAYGIVSSYERTACPSYGKKPDFSQSQAICWLSY